MRRSSLKCAARRISIFQAVLFILMGVIIIRLFMIQVCHHDFYVNRVFRRRKISQGTDQPQRGTIYDRQGRLLAGSVKIHSIYAVPGELRQESKSNIQLLCKLLHLDLDFIRDILKSKQKFIWLKRKVNPQIIENLKKLGLKGIGFRKENSRYYPGKELAAQLLGFTGTDNYGLEGAEFFFNDLLANNKESNRYSGLTKIALPAAGRQEIPLAEGPYDIFLTIDKVIQYQAEKELHRCCTDMRANAGMAIVMDTESAEILAMANWPFYNPNSFSNYQPHFYRNRCITDCFEPGSVFKVFLAAAALKEDIVKPDDTIKCEDGFFQINGSIIHDIHKYDSLSFSNIITRSSNIGSAKIGLLLGREKFNKVLRNFGFGDKTGIRLPGEVAGIIRPINEWTDLITANIAFGQGILTTPLQIITAISAIANKGKWKIPKILKALGNEKGEEFEIPNPASVRRVVSEDTCENIIMMMEKVVQDGTGKAAFIPEYHVAGKTGTAQKLDPIKRKYSKKLFCSSFVGFFPAHAPKIAILVTIDEPQKEHFSSIVAAPVFRRIAQHIIFYRNIPQISRHHIPPQDICPPLPGF